MMITIPNPNFHLIVGECKFQPARKGGSPGLENLQKRLSLSINNRIIRDCYQFPKRSFLCQTLFNTKRIIHIAKAMWIYF